MYDPNLVYNKFTEIHFSNVPGVNDVNRLKYFDNFVKNIQLPSVEANIKNITYNGKKEIHPLGKYNGGNYSFTIEFMSNKSQFNYIMLKKWIDANKQGIPLVGNNLNENITKTIKINIKDNQASLITNIDIVNILPKSISAIKIDFEDENPDKFSLDCEAEDIIFDINEFNKYIENKEI